ncbi:MAG TPA: ABC transporter substrate-binding protein [Gaiellaceae bacterium]|nr:ABC transporter substrate-binding protein [Gaiellaceae bacterium]
MTVIARGDQRARLCGVAIAGVLAVLVVFGATAASAPAGRQATVTITVNTLPIANALPLDLGIKKGFFAEQGIEITKRTLQSGNDVVLALQNDTGEIGYLGWVPAMIARTQGIGLTGVAASEVEGTSESDNWQNILVKGSSSIRTPADLSGKTVAVNALKGVGEVMIKAALKKVGVDPNSVRLLALPFPAMRSALNNGQVDAIWTPEPFMTQALTIDGARIVMAPGPVLGRFFPIGGYVSRDEWAARNPGLAARFRTAINKSLTYSQTHPDEIRELLPAATRNVRLPIWSPVVDRGLVLQLSRYAKEYGVISTLPNLARLLPSTITSGKTLQGAVGERYILLRIDGKAVTKLPAGKYTFVVTDSSKTQNFRLAGPGVNKTTSASGTGRSTWTVTLKKGTYTFSSSGRSSLKRTFRVT